MRVVLRLCLILIVTIPVAAQSKGNLSPDVLYARSKSSVVTIMTFDSHKQALGQGSGFIVAKNRVVTNYHVVAGSASVSVIFSDGLVLPANSIVAASGPRDIAILEVSTAERPFLPMGDELQLKVGESVFAIGAPSGLSGSLSNGLVSAFRQDGGQFLIQTTAPIAAGSSGGPLLNGRAEVVGITTSRLKEGGFAFAVGVGDVQRLLKVPLIAKLQPSDLPPTDHENDNGPDQLTSVRTLVDQKKYPAALTAFNSLSASTRNGFDGQTLLCSIEEEIPDYLLAVQACNVAISLRPNEARPYGLKAYALLFDRQLHEAEAAAQKAVSLSDDASFKNILGLIYYFEEKYNLVPPCFSEEQADAFTLTILAGAAFHNQDGNTFTKLYNKLNTVGGNDNGWHAYLDAIAATKDLNFEAAEEGFRKCDADPNFIDPICVVFLASTQTRLGEYRVAMSTINTAVSRYPQNHSVLSQAIFVNLLVDDPTEAKRLHEALKATPYTVQDDGTDCLYYYATGQSASATSYCAKYIQQHQESHGAWSNAGWAAVDNGEYSTAALYFAKASDLFYGSKDKHTVAQELDITWGILVAGYYSGNKKAAKELYKVLKKEYPTFVTMSALKELPLVWSDESSILITKITLDFK